METYDALDLARLSPGGLAWYDLLSPETGESIYEQPPHLKLLDHEIVALVEQWPGYEDYDGIIFTVPPRHGKSFKVSQYTPAWYLGNNPSHQVAVCSYEADFAASWGRKAREVLEARGPEVFNVEVDHSSRAAAQWRCREIKRGRPLWGGMITAGIGGPLTGRGVNLLVIDDPVKNAQEAHSKTKRDGVWNWYTSTAATRLEPGGKIIVIMTRWHDDDLAGRLIKEMEAEGWKFLVINLPAIALPNDPLGREPGEALWRERYDEERLEKIMKGLGPYVWNALFQGKPAYGSGGFFDPLDFRVLDEPESVPRKAVRRWDLAATESDGDYTAGVRMEKLANGRWLITDVRRGQWGADEIERQIVKAAHEDGVGTKIRFEQERGAAGKLIVAHYKRLLRGFSVKGEVPTGDLTVRALGVSGASQRKQIDVMRGDWNDDFFAEIGAFDHGENDDQVSALAGAWFDMEKGGAVVNF